MRSISQLREALLNVFLQESTSYDEQELFDELMVQKPRLLALLHVGSRNSEEQKEIESGVLFCLLYYSVFPKSSTQERQS